MPIEALKNGGKGTWFLLFHYLLGKYNAMSYFILVGLCKLPLAMKYSGETGNTLLNF